MSSVRDAGVDSGFGKSCRSLHKMWLSTLEKIAKKAICRWSQENISSKEALLKRILISSSLDLLENLIFKFFTNESPIRQPLGGDFFPEASKGFGN